MSSVLVMRSSPVSSVNGEVIGLVLRPLRNVDVHPRDVLALLERQLERDARLRAALNGRLILIGVGAPRALDDFHGLRFRRGGAQSAQKTEQEGD